MRDGGQRDRADRHYCGVGQRYSRANYFELPCAFSFVSRRGFPELVATADFSPSTHSPYESEVIAGASRITTGTIARIPLSYYASMNTLEKEGVKRLRCMKDASRLTAPEAKQGYTKSANVVARKLSAGGVVGHAFSDLKVLHAAITQHVVFREHCIDLNNWVEIACDRRSSALKRKCSVVTLKKVEEKNNKKRSPSD